MKHYILMADIIKSSDQNPNVLMDAFRKVTSDINLKYKKEFESPITITLGDEFQSIVKSLKVGLEVIINLEEHLIEQKRKFKLRYVLNYGEIATPINPNIALQMYGEGLTKARSLLGSQKKEKDRFLIENIDAVLSRKINLTFNMYQSIVDEWKYRDFKVIASFIKHKDYKKVAIELEKDRSLMWRREKSLNIKEYFIVKELIFLLAD